MEPQSRTNPVWTGRSSPTSPSNVMGVVCGAVGENRERISPQNPMPAWNQVCDLQEQMAGMVEVLYGVEEFLVGPRTDPDAWAEVLGEVRSVLPPGLDYEQQERERREEGNGDSAIRPGPFPIVRSC